MSMQLDRTVPFGRTRREYEHMLALTEADRRSRLLDCAAGPSSFNAEWTADGGRVCSIDPLYQFTGAEIQRQFHAVLDQVIDQVRATPDDWVWTYHRDPDDLRRRRLAAMDRFVADYPAGQAAGRYRCAALPALPFEPGSFDLALCSHFLFLYSEHFDRAFHLAALNAMLLTAREVRVFPLLTLQGVRSPHLEPVCERLRKDGFHPSIERVSYELQRGGHEMLRIRRG